METTVKQRLVRFAEFRNLSISKFESLCGLGNGYVGKLKSEPGSKKLDDILRTFPELNRDWLLYGEGEMLKPSTNTNSGDITITGNNNSHIGHGNTSTNCENCNCEASTEVQELQGAPVIPTALCREGGCDILEYIEENPEEVEISPIRAKGVTIDLWYRIRATDNSNAPTYLPGDNIAIASYPKGEERPRPGRFYVVDTYSNGFELGILFPTDSGDFRMQKKNREEFPDFTIERDDIIRIYRVIMMVRI